MSLNDHLLPSHGEQAHLISTSSTDINDSKSREISSPDRSRIESNHTVHDIIESSKLAVQHLGENITAGAQKIFITITDFNSQFFYSDMGKVIFASLIYFSVGLLYYHGHQHLSLVETLYYSSVTNSL
jgi:hypothetical protein